ncbi:MAG TPA: cation-transporting P-type ATPase [Stellaceae bacterium]|nr:cation-transporting P-type ATPase [Stellaceae bacterium]
MIGGSFTAEPSAEAIPTLASPDTSTGLTEAETARRLARFGENALAEHHASVLVRLLRFVWGPIPWMIETVVALSAVLSPISR